MAHDDSDNSSISSASSMEQDEQENQDHLEQLKDAVRTNPRNYDGHLQLVDALRKRTDFAATRQARENFHHVYPLSEDLWRAWIQDERTISAFTEECCRGTLALYKRACMDYYSFDLWMDYVRYAQSVFADFPSSSLLELVRDIHQVAVVKAGLDVCKGHEMWKSVLSFEQSLDAQHADHALVERLYSSAVKYSLSGVGELVDEGAAWKAKLGKDGDAFKTELREEVQAKAPLTAKYEAWEKTLRDLLVKHDLTAKCAGSGSTIDPEVVNLFCKYIQFEFNQFDANSDQQIAQNQIVLLFERSVSLCCLSEVLWKAFSDFVSYNVNDLQLVLDTHERAVRNCPSNVELWTSYFRAIERKQDANCVQTLTHQFERALSHGFTGAVEYFNVELSYCDSIRRLICAGVFEPRQEGLDKLNKAIEQAISLVQSWFPTWEDGALALQGYKATMEYHVLNDRAKCDATWESVLVSKPNRLHSWIECITFYRERQHIDKCREIFDRALCSLPNKAFVEKEEICRHWLQFERVHGTTIAHWDAAYGHLIKMQRKNINRVVLQQQQQQQHPKTKADGKSKKRAHPDKHTENPTTKKKKKAKVGAEPDDSAKHAEEAPKPTNLKVSNEDLPHFAPSERTVFLVNLSYDAKLNDIKKFLEGAGKVEFVKILKHPDGRPKGLASALFMNHQPGVVDRAVKFSGRPFMGRPVEVRRHKKASATQEEDSLRAKFDLPENAGKTVFVSNFLVDMETSIELVKDIMEEKCGTVKEIVLTRNHMSFLVLFDDVSSVDKALALHNTKLAVKDAEFEIHVQRHKNGQEGGAPVKKKKDKVAKSGRRTRLDVPMIPTSVARKAETTATKITPKSNDDFRKMFE